MDPGFQQGVGAEIIIQVWSCKGLVLVLGLHVNLNAVELKENNSQISELKEKFKTSPWLNFRGSK